jgi:PAS domain S-box-containing protein
MNPIAKDKEIVGFRGVIVDITEQVKSENRFRVLFESSRDAVMTLAPPSWKFTSGNPATVAMFGTRDEEDFITRAPWEYSPPRQPDGRRSADKAIEMIETAMEQGSHFFEWTHRRLDGTDFPATVLLTRMRLEEEDLLQATVRDITRERSIEAQLHQAQKLESVGILAGGVAHEINNPINGIMNYAQLISDRLGPENPVAEFVDGIGKEARRVSSIVHNLLSFSRPDKPERLPADLRNVIEITLSLIRSVLLHDQIGVEVSLPRDMPVVKCRVQQIQQLFMNLFSNARDALNEKHQGYDEDKKIIISAREVTGRETAGVLASTCLRITVEDHGTGVPEGMREHLFDPFYTSKRPGKGTGLGLSISYRIVKEHGGELSVESEVGKYTRFHVDLPLDGKDVARPLEESTL